MPLPSCASHFARLFAVRLQLLFSLEIIILLNTVTFFADYLGSVEHLYRLGLTVAESFVPAGADFVCPTPANSFRVLPVSRDPLSDDAGGLEAVSSTMSS